ILSLSSYREPPDLHSFPTRRSSDLLGKFFLFCWLMAGQAACHPSPAVQNASDNDPPKKNQPAIDANFPDPTVVLAPDGYYYVYRSEEHTSELQSRENLVCRLLLEKK